MYNNMFKLLFKFKDQGLDYFKKRKLVLVTKTQLESAWLIKERKKKRFQA